MTDAGYVPGTWVAVVGERTWLLLSVPPESDLVGRCWDLVRSDEPLDEVLAAIVHEGFRAVSGFALVRLDGTERRAVVRGETRLEVVDPSGAVDEISGAGVGTWVDRNLGEVARLRVTNGVRGPVLPVRSGVVLAGEIVVSLEGLPRPRPEPVPVPERVEHTVVRQEEPVELTVVRDEPPAPVTGVIQSFDWAPQVTTAIARPEPVQAAPPVTDTVLRTNVMSPNDTQMLHGRASGSQLVRAKRCPSGHLSSEYAVHCRVCEVPLPVQDAAMLAMPVLGALRLSNGDTITLDRNVALGRDPQGDPRSANLVQVGAESDTMISRTHVEVRLDGWDVLVRDLGSTNGTTISQPGCPPQDLAAHIPELIYPGTRVTLGDQVFFTFEVNG
ncbi:FHA domain-containing protein [Lentzea rhizosphaerae]|uniref:FHA domain-containing protein n=1 Tax=Lentzea rhizosphaerae TaxID=2041025 RepID=A0ABV8C726_9PSEU